MVKMDRSIGFVLIFQDLCGWLWWKLIDLLNFLVKMYGIDLLADLYGWLWSRCIDLLVGLPGWLWTDLLEMNRSIGRFVWLGMVRSVGEINGEIFLEFCVAGYDGNGPGFLFWRLVADLEDPSSFVAGYGEKPESCLPPRMTSISFAGTNG